MKGIIDMLSFTGSINRRITAKSKEKGNTMFEINKINKKQIFADKFFALVFFFCAITAVFALLSIAFFIIYKGIQPFIPGNEEGTYSIFRFITGTRWKPMEGIYGIGYMIVASIYATFGAILIGVPVGILTAAFISELAPARIAALLRPMIELLAGIPSVLYGVFGFAVIVPFIRNNLSPDLIGDSLLAVIIILSVMILPTIVSISETAIRSVPSAYKEAAYALGSTRIEVLFKVVLPAARNGILASVILGVGRALGETMAVILVAGNPEGNVPTSIFDQVRLITNNIVLEQGYAAGMHEEMLFATGIVLFLFIMISNTLLGRIKKRIGA